MDTSAIEAVRDIAMRRVGAGESFTAYDVTVEARTAGHFVPHGEARDEVDRLFGNGSFGAAYRRTVVRLDAGGRPFVYHRHDVDASTYRSSASGSQPVAAPATLPNPPIAGDTDDGGVGWLGRIVGIFTGAGAGADPRDPRGAKSGGRSGGPAPVRRRVQGRMNLDAGDFAPISRDELMRGSSGVSLWGNAWFGRRDIIPPASDRRTRLIDRAMVTQGLLTPEQLEDLHRIGDEYLPYIDRERRIRQAGAAAGWQAVRDDRERRRREKEQKKAEAARRERERREEIARRRENDIVFLGRGVSGGLSDRTGDTGRLETTGLPVAQTPAELATAIGITVPKLRWLAFHHATARRTHYVRFDVAKRAGGTRTLAAPHVQLKQVQTWILRNILDHVDVHDAAHGFVRGRSIVTNAAVHAGQKAVLNVDLRDFFPTITWVRVRKVFRVMGYSPSVATILALLCTESPRRTVTWFGETRHVATGPPSLPQGACTSPALSNLVAMRLDRRFQGVADRLSLGYTRYADDLTFSGESLASRAGYVIAKLRHIAADEGFELHPNKTRLQRHHQRQSVTGLVVNDRVGVDRRTRRRLRAILHRAKTEGLQAQNRHGHPNFAAHVAGLIAMVGASQPEVAERYRRELAQAKP